MSNTVVVTGGAGFIGHALIKKLIEETDYDIVSIDRLDYSGNLNRISDMMKSFDDKIKKRLKIVHHDLKAEINPLIAKEIGEIKHFFHLAASSHVDRSISDPMTFVMDNVVATCNVLNFSRNLDHLESFFYFSTDEVFGPANEGVNYKEWERYNSTNPYSASKAGGEELAIAFNNTYKLPVVITHCMNAFGERQHPEKYLPNSISKIINNKVITIHSDSENNPGSRHYVHVEDVANAVLFSLTNLPKIKDMNLDKYGASCTKINIASDLELDNLELVQIIAQYLDKELLYEFENVPSNRPGHDLRYSLDNTLLKNLGWKADNSNEEGLHQVISWYLANQNWI
jgi:dTDP-glucose 4,6-dehydratase